MLQYDADQISKEEIDTVLLAVQNSINHVKITSLHANDLRNLGFLPTDDTDIERLADKMSNDYCTQLFHTSLNIIAEANGVYHSKQAMETLSVVSADIVALPFDKKEDENIMLQAHHRLNKSYRADDFKEWNYAEVLKAMEVMENNLWRFNDEKTTTSYTNLINRVKELIEWSNNSLIG
jgi:hypothetical protein